MTFTRITARPDVCTGKPCIRNLRFPVSRLLGLLASGQSREDILRAYPYLEFADRIGRAMTKLAVIAVALVLAGCAFPVQGKWVREPTPGIDPQRTIVILYNHGFSRQNAGTYEAKLPPILERAANASDVLVYS